MEKIFHFALIAFFLCPFLSAQKNYNTQLGLATRAYLNQNNITTIFKNTGISDIDPSENSGFIYPAGTGKTAVYVSGLLWGAKIVGDPQVRIGGSTYREGLQGGWITELGNIIPPSDPRSRIYRVRRDVYPEGPPVNLDRELMDEMLSYSIVRTQYETNWIEWPTDLGAPYFDGNQNGQYDPDPSSGDIPGIKDATQTIWFVANDQDPALTQFLYGTLPIGMEYQATMWEYKDSLGFNNFFFRKYKLINKTNVLGFPITFKDMYISMWSDIDVGDSNDDYVGCDTVLNLGFGYNAFSTDLVYDPLPPPVVGFDLIRGPLVPGNPDEDKNKNGIDDIYDYGFNEDNQPVYGFINLPMTAFYYFIRGDSSLTDPNLGSSQGASQFYNFMQGKIGTTGAYFINPVNSLATTYALSGNPVNGSGWIDGMLQAPKDRRLGLSTGPIQMAPGDTQLVVIAEIAGGATVGIDYLSAIDTVKKYSKIAQKFYDTAFLPLVSVSDNKIIPIKFNLSQSYPNPFNPSTNTQYAVGSRQFVTLKIYDVLGREIATLVNEEKEQGIYGAEFNTQEYQFASGIYLYRLQAGSYVETKKMVLMK